MTFLKMPSIINNVFIIKTIFSLFIYWNFLNVSIYVESSRADLGTYLHISPSVEEKTPEELYVLAFINYTYISDGREVFFAEEKGRYGEGKILNVQGFLEHITSIDDILDHTACTTQIRGTNGDPLPIHGSGKPWIALIKRGKCTFEEKIKHAWKHGAVGVIVYNEIPAVSLEKMKIIEKDRNITAIFTYKWIGDELGRIVDEGNRIWVSISEGQRGMKPQHNINNFQSKLMYLSSLTRHLFPMSGTSVLFVSISFIVLMIISLVWLIFYYIQRFRYLQSKDQHSRHLCAVAKRVIMKIPTKSGKCNETDNENDCCAICIELYKGTDCIRVLPCKHEFHKNCIDPWLLEHRTCPMCKLDVLKHYGFVCTLHFNCPAQANRVFWEVFPTRYIGSEESILQLDLDMEIGDHGLNSGDDDRFSIDNPRISHTTPSFHVQTFDDHSHLVRDLSIDSVQHIHRLRPGDIPERSQSSLSCLNRMFDETANKLSTNRDPCNSSGSGCGGCNKDTTQQNTVIAEKSTTATKNNSNFLNPDNIKRDKESISLPGTLKKKRSSGDSCRGSNNCYIKAAADLKQLAAKIEKGCPKSRTAIVRQASDDEHLLDNSDSVDLEIDVTNEIIPSSTILKTSPTAPTSVTPSSSSSTGTTVSQVVTPQIRIECESDDETSNKNP